MEIVLASTSPYRRNLMRRLGLPFKCVAPEVDEYVQTEEEPEHRAIRLARLKAQSASTRVSSPSLSIGSDQVACLGDRLFRKPGTDEGAAEQLAAASGNLLKFWTGVCVVSDSGALWSRLVGCEVQMRELSSAEIQHYIAIDRPLDCAGSFKWEALGISLFEFVRSSDPTALEGLPLIALCDLLRQAGISLPSAAQAGQD